MSYIPPSGAGILLEPGTANPVAPPPILAAPGYSVPFASAYTTSVLTHANASLVDGVTGLVIQATPNASGTTSAYLKPVPAGDWNVSFETRCAFTDDATQGVGVAVRSLATSKPLTLLIHQTRGAGTPSIAALSVAYDGSTATELNRRSNPFRATYMRITYTSSTSTLKQEMSSDGGTWVSIGSYTLANQPGYIGPAVFSNFASTDSNYLVTGIVTGWIQSW